MCKKFDVIDQSLFLRKGLHACFY